MMYQVHIDDLVPQNNFYRLLDKELDLHFLYKATAHYYGYEGQESIDPKHVLMAALTYNLKKYLKFVTKKAISKAIAIKVEVKSTVSTCFSEFWLYFSP